MTLPPIKSSRTCPGTVPAQDQGDSLRLLGPSAWWGQSGAGWAEPGRVVVPKSRDPGRCLAKETVLVGGTGCLGPADQPWDLEAQLDSSLSYGSAVSVSRSLLLELGEHLGGERRAGEVQVLVSPSPHNPPPLISPGFQSPSRITVPFVPSPTSLLSPLCQGMHH